MKLSVIKRIEDSDGLALADKEYKLYIRHNP